MFASLPFCQVMSLLYKNVVCKFRNSRPEVFCKKEILAQVFSYEFCEIFKNTFFHRTYLVAAWSFWSSNVSWLTVDHYYTGANVESE